MSHETLSENSCTHAHTTFRVFMVREEIGVGSCWDSVQSLKEER